MSRGRRSKERVPKSADKRIRELISGVRRACNYKYADVDREIKKGERWTQNAFNRGTPLATDAACILLSWAASKDKMLDKTTVNRIAFEVAALKPAGRGINPVPLLVLARDIERVSDAFDEYLKERSRSSAAKGLLKEFLKRPPVKPAAKPISSKKGRTDIYSYARLCAFELAIEVRERVAKRQQTSPLKIMGEGKTLELAADDLHSIILVLEAIDDPRAFDWPTGAQRRKVRGG